MDSNTSVTNSMLLHFVEKRMHVNELIIALYNAPSPNVFEHFKVVNSHIKNHHVEVGQVVLISPANSMECTREELAFLEFAHSVDRQLEAMSQQERTLLAQRYDLLSNVASYNGAFIGYANTAWKAHVKQVETILREIERTYSSSFNKTGNLNNNAFFAKRKILFQRLDTALSRFGQPAIGGALVAGDMRRNLGLSSKSIVHNWKDSRTGAVNIPGYEKHYAKVAKLAKNINRVGYIGIGLSVVDAETNIRQACLVGNEEVCAKSKFTQRGKMVGSIAGGALVGGAAYGACNLVFGVPSLGTSFLWCGIVATGVGGYVGSQAVGKFGEYSGELIYEKTR